MLNRYAVLLALSLHLTLIKLRLSVVQPEPDRKVSSARPLVIELHA